MPELKWGPNLVLGVAAMDEQHRRLIAVMNDIQALDERRADAVSIERELHLLRDLTRQHFVDEEAHMAAIGYVDLKRHALIHADLRQSLDRYLAAFAGGNGRLPEGFVRFLVYWLSAHIQGIDRKYATQPTRSPTPAAT